MTNKSIDNLSWDSHPIREESKFKSIILCLLVAGFTVFSFYYLGTLYGLITLIVLVFSLYKYFFKTSYLIDSEKILIKTPLITRSRPWNYFKRYYISNDHIGLSSEVRPTRLDNFRSIIVKLPKDQCADEIKSFVRSKLEDKCLN